MITFDDKQTKVIYMFQGTSMENLKKMFVITCTFILIKRALKR